MKETPKDDMGTGEQNTKSKSWGMPATTGGVDEGRLLKKVRRSSLRGAGKQNWNHTDQERERFKKEGLLNSVK